MLLLERLRNAVQPPGSMDLRQRSRKCRSMSWMAAALSAGFCVTWSVFSPLAVAT